MDLKIQVKEIKNKVCLEIRKDDANKGKEDSKLNDIEYDFIFLGFFREEINIAFE